MEKFGLTVKDLLCHLRRVKLNKEGNLQILNLLDYVEKHGCESKIREHRILEEVLQILTSSPANLTARTDGVIVFECVIWMTHLQEEQKLPLLNESQFGILLHWLIKQEQCQGDSKDADCKLLIALGSLFVLHPVNGDKYFVTTINYILKYITYQTSIELLVTALQCLQNILCVKSIELSNEQNNICGSAGSRVLQIFYDDWKIYGENRSVLLLILSSLQILYNIITLHSNFAKTNVDELLGLARTYFHFGVDATNILVNKPQKVSISQQALYDSAEDIEIAINSVNSRICGGKTLKTRKPRAVVKNSRPNEYRNAIHRSPDNKIHHLVFDIKLSDSEISDSENTTNRVLFERTRKAKIRLASINLVAAISRVLERNVLFGYWHVLLPNGTAESNDNILYISQHDPNVRCRSTALQVCAQLLYGSKGFLHQAETNFKRCPTTFMPFSVSLGHTILAIYKSLMTILSFESSLPVLTHALKCLAVLVQSSPIQKFEKGFVQKFIKVVKPLIYHRDATIQVAALMVIEFLIALPETTRDIAEALGLPSEISTRKICKLQHPNNEKIDIVEIEEFVESEDEACAVSDLNKMTKIDFRDIQSTPNTSWLLLRVLYNLTRQDQVIKTSVRIESLQVLIVMSSHFAMIKSHLLRVSEVLMYSLSDSLPDIRLYAARCVDSCAYQINRYLLENVSSCSEHEIEECCKFWLNMMPMVINHIQRNSEETSAMRIALCDALSNIGVIMFEKIPHQSQISLLSFLSGESSDCTEQTVVRAAAVRALAVFALYPSLREDMVFIENTAELALRLVNDSNLFVRIKSFWSLGNISDTLIRRGMEVPQGRLERISDDLLYRLINASIIACNDNDKVRCNVVRTLGNLLRLLIDDHFYSKNNNFNWHHTFEKAICKLSDCIRSSGNAKVKWNTCYAISNLMQNRVIFQIYNLNWQLTLYSALCYVIIHHSNFKVRINASIAITNITDRSHFGLYYEKFWLSVLEAIEQSYNLENFYEYNHRDNLQEQLCLALSHILKLAGNDDLLMLKKYLLPHVEIIRSTWNRVINRMVPEKAAPLLSCPVILLERAKFKDQLPLELKNAIEFLIEAFTID